MKRLRATAVTLTAWALASWAGLGAEASTAGSPAPTSKPAAGLAGGRVAAPGGRAGTARPETQAAPPRPAALLTPETAGPDFQVQGEYEGTIGGDKARKLGVQVIALGKGQFRAVLLEGGLPGAGWNGKTRLEAAGKTEGGETAFAGPYAAAVDGGRLAGKTDKGEAFEARKVMRESPTAGAKPPQGAIILFEGTGVDEWAGGRMDERKLLTAGTRTKRTFQSFTLHVEFIVPFEPAEGAGRGNSGVYLQDRYEIQILDSFGRRPERGGCGALYQQTPPSVNMSLPPLSWQTFDVEFQAARFDESGKKTANAVITVRHNGVVVHDKAELANKTGSGKPEGPAPGVIYLQAHGHPVFFRNVWIAERK